MSRLGNSSPIRLIAIAALLLALCWTAHAEETTPNLFQSLGKLFQGKSEAPGVEASPPAESSAAGRNLTRQGGQGGRRVALVIGNGAYKGEDLKSLANPSNDAEDMAVALRRFGFEVLAHKNLNRRQMKDAIAEFGRKASNADAALFYYAGHGIQIKNQNYLIPVDASVRSEADVVDEGINVNLPLEELENARSRVNLVLLDACRNNDFSGRFRGGGSRGLAVPASLPKGTIIVYATDPGNVASDGVGRNGLFTSGLLTAFKGEDLSLDGVLTTASAVVEEKSGGKQTPYVNGPQLVKKNFYFIFKGPTTVQVQAAPAGADPQNEAWKAAQESASVEGYQAYLESYPKGRYAAAARVRLADLKKSGKSGSAPALALPAPAAVEDAETQLWNEVKASGAKEYFDAYLKQYPRGKYIALAKIELKKLDDRDKAQLAREGAERQQAAERERQEAQRAEQSAWEKAKEGATAAAYAGYLERYPKGSYATLAQAAQQKLHREAGERERQQEEERQRSEAARQRREAEKAAGDLRPGKVFRDCGDCPEMVVIPAGSFEMGSPASESGRVVDEDPQHRVHVRSFAAGKFEVARGQFAAFVRETGYDAGNECGIFEGGKWQKRSGRNWQNPGYSQADNHPVVCVSWNDARVYSEWLSRKTKKNYRLLSEAEWEYAARAGTSTARYWGESPDQACAYANVMDATGKSQIPGVTWEAHNCNDGNAYTASVGSFKANAFGLYDMIGNAWEWTEDCWNKDYAGAPNDGTAWTTGECSVGRVLRGGSWFDVPQIARAAFRYRGGSSYRGSSFGFRLARMLP